MDIYKKVSLWAIKIGLFIVPFIPLYVSRSLFFPYITGKAFAFRIITEVILALWIGLAIFYKEFRPKKSLLLYAAIAFLVVISLATAFGVNPERSFWSNFERMEGWLAHFHLFAFFIVAAHTLKKKDWFIFFNLFVVAGLGQNIVAFLQKLGVLASPQGGIRTDGTIGNATYVAAYSIFVLAISLLLFTRAKIRGAQIWYGFMTVFTLLTIYFTATRGVILALFIGLLISGGLYLFLQKIKNPRDKIYRNIVIGALILLVATGTLLQVFKSSAFVKNNEALARIASISFNEGKTRFRIWNIAFQGFKENPILGWGPDNFNAVFAKYYDPGLYGQEPWFDRAHQIALDWLITGGVLGLGAYLALFVTALMLLWRTYKAVPIDSGEKKGELKIAILISALFFVYLLQNLFVFDQFSTYMSFFAILAYIHASSTERMREKEKEGQVNGDWAPLQWAGVGVSVVALAVSLYFFNVKPAMANKELLKALAAGNLSSFDHFKNAISLSTLGKVEAREQMAQFTAQVLESPDVNIETKQTIYEGTVEELERGEKEAPLDPRIPLFLGIVYTDATQYNEALAAFERALKLTPRKQQIMFQIGDLYIRQNEYAKAEEILKKAFDLEPRFAQARVSLIAGYILNNHQDLADKLLVETYGKKDVPQLVLAQAYTRKKDYRRLLGVWQALLEENKTNLQYWKNVAATYLELGDRANAIKTLQDAIKQDPSFKTEGEGYITEIRAGRL